MPVTYNGGNGENDTQLDNNVSDNGYSFPSGIQSGFMTTSAPTIATPSTYLTCSTQQLLEAIGVLAQTIVVPYKNANLTGLFNCPNNALTFPDNAANQFLASQVYIDCNNTVPGNIVMSFSLPPNVASNIPIPADGPFGVGISVLSTLQLMECIAVLLKELIRPYPSANQTGLFPP